MIIEIDGDQYEYIEKEQKKSNSKILPLFATALILGGTPLYPQARIRPDVIIVEEYIKIKNKKSSLSRSDRDWVEDQFHLHFKKVEKTESALDSLSNLT